MNENLTDINILIDRSGSMNSIKHDTIGGFNTFINRQKDSPGEANVTLVQFDDQYEVVYSAIPITDVKNLDETTFVPRGWTALLDALGRLINSTGERLRNIPEEKRPGKVIFVVVTDGQENASTKFSGELIKSMVKHQTDVYNWDFIFLGANIDSISTATSFGFKPGNSMNFGATSKGVNAVFNSISENMSLYRGGDFSKKDSYFTAEDRSVQDC